MLLSGRNLDRKFAWTSAPIDCDNRGAYIYNRIFEDTTPVDIALIGTSRTINGLMDTLMSRRLTEAHYFDDSVHVANLGYCRFGNELPMIIAQDLFSRKKPSIVLIEISERFGVSSHPMYPYFASTSELFAAPSYANQSALSNLYNGFLVRVTQTRSELFGFEHEVVSTPPYGYRGYPDSADPASLKDPDIQPANLQGAWRSIQTTYVRAWIQSLVELCKANGSKVFFVYMPSFHDQPTPLEGMDFYQKLAPVWIIDRNMIGSRSCWRENDHFNDKGAYIFSEWLCSQLINN